MKNSNNIIGFVHSIDTYSTLDGFGIRSVVFMQGCDLRCIYCHNPDTWDISKGTKMTVTDICDKIKNYTSYYGNKGGVTFGGGEPLKQAKFVNSCIDAMRKMNVKCAIETSGNVDLSDDVKELLKKLDFVICDLKFPTNEEYLKYTCASFDKTSSFLKYLQEENIPVWIRTVIVPDINDSEEKLQEYQKIVKSFKNVIKWELLPLSKLGFTKYEKLNILNRLKDVKDLDMTRFKILQEKYEIKCTR